MSSDSEAGVIDRELWERVSAAFPAVDAAIDRHLAEGGRVPSADVPVMGAFDGSGWPRVEFPFTRERGEVPDYARLFGPAAGSFTPFAYADVPELAAVIAYVAGRADLAAKLDVVPDSTQASDEARPWLVTLEAARLVLSVVDRARALGRPGDPEALLAAYRERERSLLATELDVDLVAPLVLTKLHLEGSLDLGGGVRLEKLDEEVQLARASRLRSAAAVPPPVVDAATHAVVITGVKIDNSSLAARLWRGSSSELPFGELDLAVGCLRAVTRAATGYAQVFLRPVGWADRWTHALPPVVDAGVFRRYPASFDNFGWLKDMPEVAASELAVLPDVVRAAREAGTVKEREPTRLALRRLSLAGLRDDDDDALLDACIGIEALLSEDSADLTYKIAVRGAAALKTRLADPLDPQAAFAMLKHVYARRSELVHGTGRDKKALFDLGGQKIRTSSLAVFLLRELLRSQLTSDPAWTTGDLDDHLLSPPPRDTAAGSASPAGGARPGSATGDQ